MHVGLHERPHRLKHRYTAQHFMRIRVLASRRFEPHPGWFQCGDGRQVRLAVNTGQFECLQVAIGELGCDLLPEPPGFVQIGEGAPLSAIAGSVNHDKRHVAVRGLAINFDVYQATPDQNWELRFHPWKNLAGFENGPP